MHRRVAPPDFRYVWLLPEPTSVATALSRAAIATGIVGAGLSFGLHASTALGLSVAAVVAGAAALLGRSAADVGVPFGARAVPMAITPWGILVTPETELRILRWPSIRRVEVATAHTLRGGTPSAHASVVTVHVGREVLAGRSFGEAGLEGLTANLEAYAAEASRAVAGDLEGGSTLGDSAIDPVVAELLSRARELCESADGANRLSLAPSGYRDVAARAAGPETSSYLGGVLEGAEGVADPRPLAALLAGELGAASLTPHLVRLGTSPHPLVAGAARAAAIRLGAPATRAGALDELGAFLLPDDLELLETWAKGA